MIKKLRKKMSKAFSLFKSKDKKAGHTTPLRRKMVVVGDGECGKTCLVSRMCTGSYADHGYLPTVFDTEVVSLSTGKENVELTIYDTAGQEDYDRLRPFSYHDVDVAVICFSLADTDTLTNVSEKWMPEVKYFCGNIPIILVGNKKDLRDSPLDLDLDTPSSESPSLDLDADDVDIKDVRNILCGGSKEENRLSWLRNPPTAIPRSFFHVQAPVKHSEGVLTANQIGAIAYFETSALSGDNVEELLLATTKASVLGSKKSKSFKPFSGTLKSWRSIDYLENSNKIP